MHVQSLFKALPDRMTNQNRFKLLHLPYLAQREVWKSMSYQDFLSLSLCSTRTYNFMTFNKLRIPGLEYEDEENELRVNILNEVRFDDEYLFVVKSVPRFRSGSDVVRLNIGGIGVECIWETYGIVITDSKRHEVQLATDKHLHGLFRMSTVELKLSAENVAQNIFPNVQNITDLALKIGDFEIELLEEILEKYPNQKSLNVGWKYTGDILLESKLFQIDDIHVAWSAHNSSLLLENFTRRCITLDSTELDETAVIRFLEQWASGQKYQNLWECHLYVRYHLAGFDVQKVLNTFRGKAKSRDRPNGEFTSSRAIFLESSRNGMMLFHKNHTLDIERDTDGKKSTFTIFEKHFHFCVWH